MSLGADFLQWGIETFGHLVTDRHERALRFVEEAIELAQAEGLTKEQLQAIVDRVYSRPAGDVGREIGQSAATLEMLAANIGYSAKFEAEREFERVKRFSKEHWQARHQAKVDLGIAK